ncbi:MAG: PEGA domain-containing protein, partial [Myxococcota bacterium]
IAGQPLVIDEVLQAIEGQLTVMPTPREAHVVVDGISRGTGRVQVHGLPLDRPVEVRVELDGYGDFTQALELTKDKPHQTLAVPLAIDPRARRTRPKSRKVVITAPYGTWANVYYRNRALGSTPIEATLPIGLVKLRVRNDELKIDKLVDIQVPRSGSNQVKLSF